MRVPPNIQSINDALQVVTTGRIRNSSNYRGESTLDSGNIKVLLDKGIDRSTAYQFSDIQA